MVSYRNFIITTFVFLFTVSTGSAIGEKPAAESDASSIKTIVPSNYHMEAKVSAKDKASLVSFNSDDLTWSDENTTPISKNSGWIVENGAYTWEPGGKSQFIKIPLRQKNATKNRQKKNKGCKDFLW